MASNEAIDPGRKRSGSRNATSRPTTPLRPSSRSSFRESAKASISDDASFPLNTFEPAFAELSDAMADLEANMMHFQLMHESLARFSESFASFLYGLNMNAFCVDFPEVFIQCLTLDANLLGSLPNTYDVRAPLRSHSGERSFRRNVDVCNAGNPKVLLEANDTETDTNPTGVETVTVEADGETTFM